MLLRDPFILHTISRSVIVSLHKLMNESKLPRVSKDHLIALNVLKCPSCRKAAIWRVSSV